jgi:hypothetical protein
MDAPPLALGDLYLLPFPMPLVFLPALWLSSIPVVNRWGFLSYFALSFAGFAFALWVLAHKLHFAFPLVILVPTLSLYFHNQLPLRLRYGFSSLSTVLVMALAGWWLRDAANRFDTSAAPTSAA